MNTIFRGLVLPVYRSCSSAAATYGEKCLNAVTLLGRTGSEAQIRGSEQHPVVVFPLATNTYHRNGSDDKGNEVVQHTQWHRISVFRPLLRESVLKNMSKGQRILVRGSISYYSTQDSYGHTFAVTSIVADDVIFLNRSSKLASSTVDYDSLPQSTLSSDSHLDSIERDT